jgi:hypothetical protein
MTDRREEIISAVFSECAALAQASGDGGWKLSLAGGKTIPASARLLDDWLTFDAPFDRSRRSIDCWRLLALNFGLSRPGKIALVQGRLHARIEVALPEDERLPRACAEACAGIVEVAEALERLACDVGKAGPPPVASTQADTEVNLVDVCKEAGWDFVERAEGALAVRLDTRAGFHQALVERSARGAVVGVEVWRATGLTELSRRAIGAFLLRASGRVRMARATVEECGEQSIIGFEARLGANPRAEEMRSALSALSIACDWCAREVAHLQDERVAEGYLAINSV